MNVDLERFLIPWNERGPLFVYEPTRMAVPRGKPAVKGFGDPEQWQQGEGERRPVDKRVVLVYIERIVMKFITMKGGESLRAKIANKPHAMAMLAGRSPSGLEKAYAADVASRKSLGCNTISTPRTKDEKRDSQAQEDKDLGENSGRMCWRVDSERLESSEDNQDSRPSVIKGERKMNPN